MTSIPARGSIRCLVPIMLAALVGCEPGSAAGPDDEIRVTVEDVSLEYQGESGTVSGRMMVAVFNEGPSSVWLRQCGESLERRVGDGWATVWFEMCLLSTDEVEIPPGATHTLEFRVAATVEVAPAEEWIAPLDGSYRVRLAMRTDRRSVDGAMSTSKPFAVQAEVH